jgi:hypothetical protein
MSNGSYKILNDKEVEQRFEEAWDRVCLKLGVKPLRPDGKDSWAQIQHDFPSLFRADK